MESIDNARDFISFLLPAEVNEHLDLGTLSHAKESFVNKNLNEIISDVVFTCQLQNSEEELYVSILIEHKSYKDKFSSFQILQYLSAGYKIQIINRKNRENLKLIIPVLYYHNKDNWEYQEVSSFFEHVPEVLRRYVPRLNTLFINLLERSD
ncbi:MAG: putative transposase/invertase (TIGR01784 family) [Halioglobus sp.]|jgi:predicted transposase/invertase (TIGR01784 family)